MNFTNSPLVQHTKISPNCTRNRNHSIDRITPHCVVGQCSVESIGNMFLPASRKASSNYGIGADGRIGMYCEEKDRSWCSSSSTNDHRAITIECASDATAPYAFNDAVYDSLIRLCVDICQRNGKIKLLWLGDKTTTLNYSPKSDEMILTVHRWFANKSCPGDWMYSRMGDLAEKVTAALKGETAEGIPAVTTPAGTETVDEIYRVRKTWENAGSQLGAFRNLAYAKSLADENPGTYVFDGSGKAIYPTDTGTVNTDALEEFIRECQKAFGVTVDGIVGAITLGAAPTLSARKNASHAAVKPVQKYLATLGYEEVGEIDGIAGVKFTSAVAHYQQDRGLSVDGIIGPVTWKKLLGV